MVPDKVHSTIDIEVNDSCNNCCCFPRRQKLTSVRRQPLMPHLQAVVDSEIIHKPQEQKVDTKAQEVFKEHKKT